MSNYILIALYFSIGGFVTGFYINDYDFKGLNKALVILLFIFISPVLSIAGLIWAGVDWIATLFQIRFFASFLFTNHFDNWPHEKLREVSERVAFYKNTNSLRHRIFRYTMYLVNKRNKFYKGFVNKNTGTSIKKPTQ